MFQEQSISDLKRVPLSKAALLESLGGVYRNLDVEAE